MVASSRFAATFAHRGDMRVTLVLLVLLTPFDGNPCQLSALLLLTLSSHGRTSSSLGRQGLVQALLFHRDSDRGVWKQLPGIASLFPVGACRLRRPG